MLTVGVGGARVPKSPVHVKVITQAKPVKTKRVIKEIMKCQSHHKLMIQNLRQTQISLITRLVFTGFACVITFTCTGLFGTLAPPTPTVSITFDCFN